MNTFNLELNMQELDVIGQALLELPAKHSMSVIQSINIQTQKQIQEAEAAAKESSELKIQDRIREAIDGHGISNV